MGGVVEERCRIQIGNKQYGRCSVPKYNKWDLDKWKSPTNIPLTIVVITEEEGYHYLKSHMSFAKQLRGRRNGGHSARHKKSEKTIYKKLQRP